MFQKLPETLESSASLPLQTLPRQVRSKSPCPQHFCSSTRLWDTTPCIRRRKYTWNRPWANLGRRQYPLRSLCPCAQARNYFALHRTRGCSGRTGCTHRDPPRWKGKSRRVRVKLCAARSAARLRQRQQPAFPVRNRPNSSAARKETDGPPSSIPEVSSARPELFRNRL